MVLRAKGKKRFPCLLLLVDYTFDIHIKIKGILFPALCIQPEGCTTTEMRNNEASVNQLQVDERYFDLLQRNSLTPYICFSQMHLSSFKMALGNWVIHCLSHVHSCTKIQEIPTQLSLTFLSLLFLTSTLSTPFFLKICKYSCPNYKHFRHHSASRTVSKLMMKRIPNKETSMVHQYDHKKMWGQRRREKTKILKNNLNIN